MSDIITFPLQSISKTYLNMLKKCNSNPQFYSVIIGYIVEPDVVVYTIEFGLLHPSNENITVKRINLRYSKILSLYESVVKEYPTVAKIQFPPKKWWNNVNKETAEYRLAAMQPFIQRLNQFPTIQSNNIFEKLFLN